MIRVETQAAAEKFAVPGIVQAPCVGQPFGYATLPQATLVAKNAGGGPTGNDQGAL